MKRAAVASVCILVILSGSCGFISGEPDLLLKGIITDRVTGEPIAGAVVSDGTYGPQPPRSGVSDQQGAYSFLTWYEEHTIWTEAPGYERESATLITKFLGKEKEKTIDFQLKPLK